MENKNTLSSSSSSSSLVTIPQIPIGSNGLKMPLLGMGTASSQSQEPEVVKCAVMEAIKLGYRHFDTAPIYNSEQPLGEAISQSLSLGLVHSRDEFFITSKLWLSDAHQGLVLPALKRSLENLKLEYLDLYLIHWPLSSTPGQEKFPTEDDLLPMDFKAVWSDMEECQKLGLARSIGVSNFSCKKLSHILSFAKIPPAVNEVEMNPLCQQKKLREFCKEKGIVLIAYAVLGATGSPWGDNKVMESEDLKELAKSTGKPLAQICLRWVYEQGVCPLVKSFNKDRMKQNLGIFEWSLTEEASKKIDEIPHDRSFIGEPFISIKGPMKTLEDLWDGEV